VTVRATIGVLVFLGLTATGGGFALTFGPWAEATPPREWLDRIPVIDSWVVPGLVLGIGFGLGSLVAAYGMARTPEWSWLAWAQRLTGRHWSWLACTALGLGQLTWIGLEVIYLPENSWLEVVYAVTGAILVGLALSPSVRSHLATGRRAGRSAPSRPGR
jgi:hypothetical protein